MLFVGNLVHRSFPIEIGREKPLERGWLVGVDRVIEISFTSPTPKELACRLYQAIVRSRSSSFVMDYSSTVASIIY